MQITHLALQRSSDYPGAVTFQPPSILIVTDPSRGYCGRVVPQMVNLLEHRSFVVDVHTIDQGPIDCAPYNGVVLGTPVFGLGIRGVGPTEDLTRFVQHDLGDLDEVKVAVFCVYSARVGTTFDRMRGLLHEVGAEFVAAHAYPLLRPSKGAHILPTECMVRIR